MSSAFLRRGEICMDGRDGGGVFVCLNWDSWDFVGDSGDFVVVVFGFLH